MDTGKYTALVFKDLKKVLDNVDHDILLKKMQKFLVSSLPGLRHISKTDCSYARSIRGGSSQKLQGAAWRRGAKNMMESERAEGALKFLGHCSRKLSGFSTKQRRSLYVPLHSERNTEKERIWVRIRGAVLAKKGAPKLSFHREGGGAAPSAPYPPLTG